MDNIMLSFQSKEELREFLDMHVPLAIKPVRPARTMFVAPFTSARAEKIVLDVLADALWKKS